MSVVDDFLEELVEEGELDSQGSFTLDPEQARKKLASSRFLGCVEGILAIISGWILANSQVIKVASSGSGWVVESDAPPPDRSQMERLLEQLFAEQQEPWLRELGMAFNSLVPRHCRQLRWQCQNGWEACFAQERWTCNPWEGDLQGLQQRVTLETHSLWKRPWQWLQQRWLGLNEARLLRSRTIWSPVPVLFPEVSSYQLDPPQAPPHSLALLSFESRIPALQLPDYHQPPEIFRWGRSCRARTSLRFALLDWEKTSAPPNAAKILLVYRGVTLAQQWFNLPGFSLEGVANSDSLDLDVSRQQVVQNSRLKGRVQSLRLWAYEGIGQWLQQLRPDQVALHRQALARAQANHPQPKVLRAALARLPLLLLRDGQTAISLDELQASLQRFGAVHFGDLDPEGYFFQRPVLASRLSKTLLQSLQNPRQINLEDLKFPRDACPPTKAPVQRFTLSLPEGRAVVGLGEPPGKPDVVLIRLQGQGQLLASQVLELFAGFPNSLHITLTLPLEFPLDHSYEDLLESLRKGMESQLEGWIESWIAQADAGALAPGPFHHYCWLLLLWKKRHRRLSLPPAWACISLPRPALIKKKIFRVDEPELVKYVEPDHPIHRLQKLLAKDPH